LRVIQGNGKNQLSSSGLAFMDPDCANAKNSESLMGTICWTGNLKKSIREGQTAVAWHLQNSSQSPYRKK
jgi:hypothetical protein